MYFCVLSAITASMTGKKQAHRRPVMTGAGIAFGATIITWFIATGILSDLSGSVSALNLQAATGLLAVVVLLIIMNWFFHRIYWGGWMSMHNRRKKGFARKRNLRSRRFPRQPRFGDWACLISPLSTARALKSFYFCRSYYLRMGGGEVVAGALLGLFASPPSSPC